jgi:hypothetical protein
MDKVTGAKASSENCNIPTIENMHVTLLENVVTI